MCLIGKEEENDRGRRWKNRRKMRIRCDSIKYLKKADCMRDERLTSVPLVFRDSQDSKRSKTPDRQKAMRRSLATLSSLPYKQLTKLRGVNRKKHPKLTVRWVSLLSNSLLIVLSQVRIPHSRGCRPSSFCYPVAGQQ